MNSPHARTDLSPPASRPAEALSLDTRLDEMAVARQLAGIAARGLIAFSGAFAALLMVIAAASAAGGGLWRAAAHALLAVAIGVAALGAHALAQRDRARAGALLLMCTLTLGVVALAGAVGLGMHAVMLGGLSMVIAVTGMLLGLRAAVALALVYLAGVAALWAVETAGWIDSRGQLALAPFAQRWLAHLVLAGAGLLAAVLLQRMVGSLITRSVSERQRLAELLDLGIDWTWEMDPQGRVTAISASFEAATGRSRAEFLRLNEPGGPQVVADAEYEAFRGEMREQRPYRDRVITFRCTDGTAMVVRGNGRPVFDAEGRVQRWIGVSRNITREREAERTRLAADAILDHAGVGIALVRGGRFERVNPALEQMLGLAPGRLQGQSARSVFTSDDDYARFMQGEAGYRAAGRRADFEREFTRQDGSRVLLRLHARGVGGAGPAAVDPGAGTIWVAEDITERRRAEQQLAEARQQAESASRAKSAFLAQMSHEIRTPLNGVLGLAQLLQDARLDPGRRAEYLTLLSGAATQLSGIVSDVLDLSKIEAGQLQFEQVDFDLHELVASTFDAHAALGRERGLAMTLTLAPGLPRRVRGDPLRVRQILANYLGNALKFTARGGITVEAGVLVGGMNGDARQGADGDARQGTVRLAVTDTGIGVSPAQRERLFQPFAQGDSSTTRRFGGTGLGLSICRELAAQMGGQVGCDSDGQRGSCFWAELPLPAVSAAVDAAAAPARAAPLQGWRVLVAEDNPVNLLIVRAMLERQGAQVLEATDGHAAVTLARREVATLALVLMDLHMPALDGLEATRALRADATTARLPIVALSAAALEHERRAAVEAGMDAFVAKPVDEQELVRVLVHVRPAGGR